MIRAMVFAAGLGTRLRPLTDNMPKALVRLAGKPMLWHVIMKLKAAGINEIVVNVHHYPEQIISYIDEEKDFAGLSVPVSHEGGLLRDTGGGIRHAAPLLRGSHFIAHNVDVLTNLSLDWLIEQARPESLATLVVSERKTSRYLLFDGQMRLVGWTNIATGEIRSPYLYGGPNLLPTDAAPGGILDTGRCRYLAFAGIHLIGPGIFDILPDKESFSIIDFYLSVCARHPIHAVVPPSFRFMDIGKPDTLPQAEDFLAGL